MLLQLLTAWAVFPLWREISCRPLRYRLALHQRSAPSLLVLGLLPTSHSAVAYKSYMGWAALVGLLVSGGTDAGTHSVTANASFDTVLTLVEDAPINFGILKAATSGTYVMDTKGVITASNGGVILGGEAVHGQIKISGSVTQTVAISTGSYVANGGVTPSRATCDYDGAPIVNCDVGGAGLAAPGGPGKLLKLGVTIDVDGTQIPGSTATPSFVVVVVYG